MKAEATSVPTAVNVLPELGLGAEETKTSATVLDPKFEKYTKMQKMMPEGAVRQKMFLEGITPDEIETFFNQLISTKIPVAVPTELDYSKYKNIFEDNVEDNGDDNEAKLKVLESMTLDNVSVDVKNLFEKYPYIFIKYNVTKKVNVKSAEIYINSNKDVEESDKVKFLSLPNAIQKVEEPVATATVNTGKKPSTEEIKIVDPDTNLTKDEILNILLNDALTKEEKQRKEKISSAIQRQYPYSTFFKVGLVDDVKEILNEKAIADHEKEIIESNIQLEDLIKQENNIKQNLAEKEKEYEENWKLVETAMKSINNSLIPLFKDLNKYSISKDLKDTATRLDSEIKTLKASEKSKTSDIKTFRTKKINDKVTLFNEKQRAIQAEKETKANSELLRKNAAEKLNKSKTDTNSKLDFSQIGAIKLKPTPKIPQKKPPPNSSTVTAMLSQIAATVNTRKDSEDDNDDKDWSADGYKKKSFKSIKLYKTLDKKLSSFIKAQRSPKKTKTLVTELKKQKKRSRKQLYKSKKALKITIKSKKQRKKSRKN